MSGLPVFPSLDPVIPESGEEAPAEPRVYSRGPLFPTLPPSRQKPILDFDCECRPIHWYGGDMVSKELTAVAWAFINPNNPRKPRGQIDAVLLGEPVDPEDFDGPVWTVPMMLEAFMRVYNGVVAQSGIVTGHYIRGFDLPLLNGSLIENGMRPLRSVLTHDTKGDLVKFQGLSKSQENLGGMLGLAHPKIQMNQADWRAANRLTEEGIVKTRKRVVGDVRQHIEMRSVMIQRGMLMAPRLWTGASLAEQYQP